LPGVFAAGAGCSCAKPGNAKSADEAMITGAKDLMADVFAGAENVMQTFLKTTIILRDKGNFVRRSANKFMKQHGYAVQPAIG
jgi:hypothetical protein